MQIEFLTQQDPNITAFKSVRFPAKINGVGFECFVSFEALEQKFGSAGDSDMLQAFLRNRSLIEAVARKNIETHGIHTKVLGPEDF